MDFLRARNPDLPLHYQHIASWYKHWGETWKVRWDYAFFQMVHETNYLKFRRGNGKRGDVHPRQNNFAGLGATGGGVPGDSFPDVRTGVLAQIHHLVVYSGERVASPAAPRTRLTQKDIIYLSRRTGRPIRFSDLTNRWAADRRYHHLLHRHATRFKDGFCKRGQAHSDNAGPDPAKRNPAATSRVRAAVPSPAVARIPTPVPARKPVVKRAARSLEKPAAPKLRPAYVVSLPQAEADGSRLDAFSFLGNPVPIERLD